MYCCFFLLQTLAVFEGLHQGQILCAAAASNRIIITGGESTVVCVWEMRKELQDKGKLSMQLKQVPTMLFTCSAVFVAMYIHYIRVYRQARVCVLLGAVGR